MGLQKRDSRNQAGNIRERGRRIKSVFFVIIAALITALTLQAAGRSETVNVFSTFSYKKDPTQMPDETIAMLSPFGLLDPIIDTPTMNNFEYYKDLYIKWLVVLREGTNFGWQSVETEKGRYDFQSHDKDICELYKQGINIIYATRPISLLYDTIWVDWQKGDPVTKKNIPTVI